MGSDSDSARELREKKRVLASLVVHDLRSPLSAIHGAIDAYSSAPPWIACPTNAVSGMRNGAITLRTPVPKTATPANAMVISGNAITASSTPYK